MCPISKIPPQFKITPPYCIVATRPRHNVYTWDAYCPLFCQQKWKLGQSCVVGLHIFVFCHFFRFFNLIFLFCYFFRFFQSHIFILLFLQIFSISYHYFLFLQIFQFHIIIFYFMKIYFNKCKLNNFYFMGIYH